MGMGSWALAFLGFSLRGFIKTLKWGGHDL